MSALPAAQGRMVGDDASGHKRSLPWLAAAGLVYAASRAPSMVLGFGSDSDAWSVADTAVGLVQRGAYHVSRAPGHPLHEFLQALPIALGGPLASNTVTLLCSIGLLIVVARLGRMLQVPRPFWAASLLAAQPLFWIASAESTDFVLAALLGTWALLAATSGAPRWAGFLLGLGMGTRVEIAVFVLPLAALSRERRPWRGLAVAALTSGLCYLPVFLAYRRSPWLAGDLYTSGVGLAPRVWSFVGGAWTAIGLVPGLIAAAALLLHRREIAQLLRRRDPLMLGACWLGGSYLLVTFVHPGKAAYYVPLLPLTLLAFTRVTRDASRVALLLSFLSYAFVYPDLVDRSGGSISFGFRWNNGLLVKDWVARWNTTRAAALIDNGRPADCDVMVLGYWLPIWRWRHLDAPGIESLLPGVRLDPRTNTAFLTSAGVRSVHKLDQPAIVAVRQAGLGLCFGEGIDEFLREAYGYDIREHGAREIPVRDLGYDVAERFMLPTLVRCGLEAGDWRECVRSRLAGGAVDMPLFARLRPGQA